MRRRRPTTTRACQRHERARPVASDSCWRTDQQVVDLDARVADIAQTGAWDLSSRQRREQASNARRRRRRQRRPIRLALREPPPARRSSSRPETPAAGQHLVRDAAERPDVRALVHRLCRAPAPGSCTPPCRGSRRRASPCAREGRRVRQVLPTPSRRRAFASPKSSTFTVPSGVSLMFAGFRSRWMILCSCAASSASAICGRSPALRRAGSRPCASRSASVGPLDQFHDQRGDTVRLFDAIDRGDVRMIERREHLRFAPEAGEAIGIARKIRGQQDFDGDLAAELGVAGAVDLAHATRADARHDLVQGRRAAFQACHPVSSPRSHRRRLEKALRVLCPPPTGTPPPRRSASLPLQASARYAGRRLAANARASANTSFRRAQFSGGSVTCPDSTPGGPARCRPLNCL